MLLFVPKAAEWTVSHRSKKGIAVLKSNHSSTSLTQTTTKSHALTIEDMKNSPQWVCWKKEKRDEKLTKVPYDARTGELASSTNKEDWTDYTTAYKAWKRSNSPYAGIGFVFCPDLLPVMGIDFDHVDEEGHSGEWATPHIKMLNSYTEYSPSHTGYHVLVQAVLPDGSRHKRTFKKDNCADNRHPEAAVEMYCAGRFFTVTEEAIADFPAEVMPRQAEVLQLYDELFPKKPEAPASSSSDSPSRKVILADDVVIEKALAAKNGAKFKALWEGQWKENYASQSDADIALCSHLAFWTGKDQEQMNRLFKKSALYRDKWDRDARAGETYGQGTIRLAIDACKEAYKESSVSYSIETPKPVTLEKIIAYMQENELGDARIFYEAFKGLVCYDHTDDSWWLWSSHYWIKDQTARIRLLVSGELGAIYLRAVAELHKEVAKIELSLKKMEDENEGEDDAGQKEAYSDRIKKLKKYMATMRERATYLRSTARCNAVCKFIQALMGTTTSAWDQNAWILPVKNGVIDLKTGSLTDGKPEDYARTVCPTEWRGYACSIENWLTFLNQMFEDRPEDQRKEIVDFLQRLLGYSILGTVVEHIITFLYGEHGRNGKDTLIATLGNIMGEMMRRVPKDVFISMGAKKTAGGPTPHICTLQGKRIVWASETQQGERLNESQIKDITGGGKLDARAVYGKANFEFEPTHTPFLLTNRKPHIDSSDSAVWRRLIFIELKMEYVDNPDPGNPKQRKANKFLKEALKEEASGILAWLVQGCLNWQKEGLNIPSFVLEDAEKYRKEEDLYDHFFKECCIIKEDAIAKAGELYQRYKAWASEAHVPFVNSILFGKEMKKRFKEVKPSNGVGYRYRGIGILTEMDFTVKSSEESVKSKVNSSVNCSLSRKPASEAGSHGVNNTHSEESEESRHKNTLLGGPPPTKTLSFGKKVHSIHCEENRSSVKPPVEPSEGPSEQFTEPFTEPFTDSSLLVNGTKVLPEDEETTVKPPVERNGRQKRTAEEIFSMRPILPEGVSEEDAF